MDRWMRMTCQSRNADGLRGYAADPLAALEKTNVCHAEIERALGPEEFKTGFNNCVAATPSGA
jgi:hypothetical protein